jgi:hypothetical protein
MTRRAIDTCKSCGRPCRNRRLCSVCSPRRAGHAHVDKYAPADPDPAPVLDVAALRARFNSPGGDP